MRTSDHVLAMVNDLHVIFGKGPGGLAILNDAEGHAPMWKKKSIFWDLPSWKELEVLGNVVISKKFLFTRKIMVMHSNERGECCPRTLVDRKRKR